MKFEELIFFYKLNIFFRFNLSLIKMDNFDSTFNTPLTFSLSFITEFVLYYDNNERETHTGDFYKVN